MAAFNKFNSFIESVFEKQHNLQSDVLKAAFSNAIVSSTFTVFGDVTEISAGNGYTAGGLTLTVASSAQSGGTYTLVVSDQSVTASGGSIADFRRVVIYNDTSTNDQLVGWYDYGATVTITTGNTFLIDFDGTNGMISAV